MRIGIFCGNTRPSDGGAFSFTKTLIDSLKIQNTKNIEFVFFYKGSINQKSTKNIINYTSGLDKISYHFERLLLKKNLLIKKSLLDKVIKKYNIDLFYFPEPAYEAISYPYIYTVWDLVHRSFPFYPEISLNGVWNERDRIYSRMLPRASYIVVGCETGKKEVLSHYLVNEDSLKIIQFPVSSFCFEKELEEVELPENFFIYPAGFYPEKNHITILKAVKYVYEKYRVKLNIIFTGADKGNLDYIKDKIDELDLKESFTIKGFVPDKQLKYIYTKASAMVFASAVGPNNLPPLEGIVCGCPVLASNVEGHIEDIGNGKYIFERFNFEQLGELMYKCYGDNNFRNSILVEQNKIREKLINRNYIDELTAIFDDFSIKRELWGKYDKNKF